MEKRVITWTAVLYGLMIAGFLCSTPISAGEKVFFWLIAMLFGAFIFALGFGYGENELRSKDSKFRTRIVHELSEDTTLTIIREYDADDTCIGETRLIRDNRYLNKFREVII